jgi:hypothetical protein
VIVEFRELLRVLEVPHQCVGVRQERAMAGFKHTTGVGGRRIPDQLSELTLLEQLVRRFERSRHLTLPERRNQNLCL